nr:MAG TPA: hypothetical protein [Bacteriophage sp.]
MISFILFYRNVSSSFVFIEDVFLFKYHFYSYQRYYHHNYTVVHYFPSSAAMRASSAASFSAV